MLIAPSGAFLLLKIGGCMPDIETYGCEWKIYWCFCSVTL